jgi:hypothetical protein
MFAERNVICNSSLVRTNGRYNKAETLSGHFLKDTASSLASDHQFTRSVAVKIVPEFRYTLSGFI